MKNVITSGRAYFFAAGLAFLGLAGVRAEELGSSKLDQELHNLSRQTGFHWAGGKHPGPTSGKTA